MSDDEKGEEVTPSHGADWVFLTASTYGAAPGPTGLDRDDERKNMEYDGSGHDSSSAMFMSDHFVFPPSEHENLPIEHDDSEIHSEAEGQDESPAEEEGDGPGKTHEESRYDKLDDDPPGNQFFDYGSTFSDRGMEFEDSKGFQGLYLVGEEQGMDIAPGFSTFHAETGISGAIPCPESTDIAEPYNSSNENIDSPQKYTKPNEEDKDEGSGLPCEAWWKRHAASLYHHAKEANTFWSIFVAAALTGIVILGKKWQRDKWHLQELKWKFGINDEKMNRMLWPIVRFKDFIRFYYRRPTKPADSWWCFSQPLSR